MASDLGLYCVPVTQRKALGMYGFSGFFFNISFLALNTSRFICCNVKKKIIIIMIIIIIKRKGKVCTRCLRQFFTFDFNVKWRSETFDVMQVIICVVSRCAKYEHGGILDP